MFFPNQNLEWVYLVNRSQVTSQTLTAWVSRNVVLGVLASAVEESLLEAGMGTERGNCLNLPPQLSWVHTICVLNTRLIPTTPATLSPVHRAWTAGKPQAVFLYRPCIQGRVSLGKVWSRWGRFNLTKIRRCLEEKLINKADKEARSPERGQAVVAFAHFHGCSINKEFDTQ